MTRCSRERPRPSASRRRKGGAARHAENRNPRGRRPDYTPGHALSPCSRPHRPPSRHPRRARARHGAGRDRGGATAGVAAAAYRRGGGKGQPRGNDLNGRPIRDVEPAQEFKLLVAELHARLEAYRLEIFLNNALEQISFRSVRKRGVNLPHRANYRRITYTVTKVNGTWTSVATRADGTEAIRIEQAEYSLDDLIVHPNYVAERSDEKRDQLRNLYQQCNPRPISNLLVGAEPPIVAGDIEFRCLDTELFSAIIEVIYAMRNALLHGELQAEEPAFRAYEPAYRIVMKFLNAVG